MNIDAAKSFIKQNARPLERALYDYYFENGSRQAVIDRLAEYQNSDGGFGHALEPDNWNELSNPIAVNDALLLLGRIDGFDQAGEMIQGIIKYLRSRDGFDQSKKRWLFAVESNSRCPHAVWWEKKGDGISGFNPTVSLAAFLVCFGGREDYYEEIVREGFRYLESAEEMGSDEVKCYLLCFELLKKNGINDLIDFDSAREILKRRIVDSIHPDLERMGIEFITTPSDYFGGQYMEFLSDELRPKIALEKMLLTKSQRSDGGFKPMWRWYTGFEEEKTALEWWRPRITIDKLLFYINC